MTDDGKTKSCGTCRKSKPVDAFGIDRQRTDGRNNVCRECRSEKYKADPASAIQRAAQYRQDNPKRIRERGKKYHAANRERRAEYRREWLRRNPTWHREYRGRNRGIYWESDYRARALEFGFTPMVETFTEEELVATWGDSCFHCNGPFEELDHFPHAVALGGEHSLTNCRPSCRKCNRSQGSSVREDRKTIALKNCVVPTESETTK